MAVLPVLVVEVSSSDTAAEKFAIGVVQARTALYPVGSSVRVDTRRVTLGVDGHL